jgi:hypothetical protein
MEESESGEKQENTGIGPASACRDSPTPSCVPDAVQREAERSGAPLIRDRHGLERSRVCSAPLRAALRPGHESAATQHSCTIALVRAKDQPAAVRNDGRGNFIVLGLLFTMTFATQTCRAAEGPICYPKCATPYVTPMWHHPSSSHVSLSVVIMCFAFEAPMPTRRIHITTSNPPPGPRPR